MPIIMTIMPARKIMIIIMIIMPIIRITMPIIMIIVPSEALSHDS